MNESKAEYLDTNAVIQNCMKLEKLAKLPLWSVIFMIVLFGDTFILQTGISLNGIPLKSLVAVVSSGKMLIFLDILINKSIFEHSNEN